jgi:hypothetical protein
MPVHDWTRVHAGTFQHFHNAWITHLAEALNGGILPRGYYAMSEQHAGLLIPDVLTLRVPEETAEESADDGGGLAIAEAPPKVAKRLIASPEATYRLLRRTLAIRHVSHDRVVALLEIVSPANKDRESSVDDIADKIDWALRYGCHVLLVDLLPPGTYDPRGIHGAIWDRYGSPSEDEISTEKPLTLSAYVAQRLAEAYVERMAVGDKLPGMPLFLRSDAYVNVPLEGTYGTAHCGLPLHLREILDGRRAPETG